MSVGVAAISTGNAMSVRLRDADARAVDLLLDRAVSAHTNGDGQPVLFAASPGGVSNEQIAAVERVLKLLDVMPASDPAPDMLRRTVERIGAHGDAPLGGHGPSLIDANRPMA